MILVTFNFNSKNAKLIFGLIVLLIAYFWPNLINSIADFLFTKSNSNTAVEKSIINSWKSFVILPERNLNRNLKIAIGLKLFYVMNIIKY